jgi:hypothetical protein
VAASYDEILVALQADSRFDQASIKESIAGGGIDITFTYRSDGISSDTVATVADQVTQTLNDAFSLDSWTFMDVPSSDSLREIRRNPDALGACSTGDGLSTNASSKRITGEYSRLRLSASDAALPDMEITVECAGDVPGEACFGHNGVTARRE